MPTPLPTRRQALACLIAASLSTLAFTPLQASEPTRLIVGFQAGGGLDTVARVLADGLTRQGRPVIVENRPGASGMIAIDTVRQAQRRHDMLLIVPGSSLTLSPHTNAHFNYDPERDLMPIARITAYGLALAVGQEVKAEGLPAYLAAAAQTPALRAYGTAGVGLGPHFVGARLAAASGVPLVHVPYKGAGPAINDAMGGQIPAVISTLPSLLPAVREGRLRLLATTGTQRDPFAPNVPTLAEMGYPDQAVEEWFGVLGPADMAPEEVAAWGEAVVQVLGTETVRDTLAAQGFVPAPLGPVDFRQRLLDDYAYWGEAVTQAGPGLLE